MARKPDDEVDFDDLDLDKMMNDDEGEGGFDGVETTPKSRNPVAKVTGSFASGVKSAMMSPHNQVQFIKSAVPPGYQQAIDVVGETVSGVRGLYDDALKEAQPVIKDLKKGMRHILPGVKGVLPGKLGEKLEAWAAEAGSSSPSVDPEESEISMNLGSIFSAYQEANQRQNEENEAKQEVRDVAMAKQQAASLQGLAALQQSIGRLVSYQDQVTVQFQRKSLELQYRQFFTTRKLLDTMQQHLEITKTSFDAIAKNTSLPDIVKAHDSERARELLKMKFLGEVTEPFSQWSRGIGRRIIGKAKSDIKGFFSNIGGAINDAVMGIEMASEGAQEMGMSGGDMAIDMAGSMAGEAAVGKLREKLAPKLREFLEKNGMFNAGNFALLRMFSEAPDMLNEWSGQYTEDSGPLGFITNWLKEGVGKHKVSNKVQGSIVDSLDQATQFDLQTRKTITDVIPGWLSKIHFELKKSRAGNSAEQEQYDWESGDFVAQKTITEKIQKKVFGKDDREYRAKRMQEFMKKFDPKDELPENIRTQVAKYLLDRARNNKPLTMSAFIHPDAAMLVREYFPNEQDLNTLQEFLIARYGKDDSIGADQWLPDGTVKGMKNKFWGGFGKTDEHQKNLRETAEAYGQFKQTLLDTRPQQEAIKYAKADGISQLAKSGVVVWDERSKEWTLNVAEEDKSLLDAFLGLESKDRKERAAKAAGSTEAAPAAPQDNSSDYGNAIPFTRVSGGIIRRASGGRIKHYLAGSDGKISAPGDGTVDTQPAMLANGEVVVNAAAASLPGANTFLGYLNKVGRKLFGKRGATQASAPPADLAGMEESGSDEIPELIKTSNMRLMEIRLLVDEISKKPFMGISLPSLPDMGPVEQMLVGGWRGAKKGAGKLWEGTKAVGSGIKKGAGVGWDVLKSLAKGTWGAAKSIGSMIGGSVTDIYVKGKEGIRLRAQDMKLGEYIDVKTQKVITTIEDITGEVKDKAGNIVLSAEDYAKGLYNSRGKAILESIGKGLSAVKSVVTAPFKMIGTIASSVIKYIDMPEDIYVPPDLKTPRVRANIFRAGGYHLADGTIPERYGDITGDLFDSNNNMVLSLDEIKAGVVNIEGKPIRGIGERIGDLVIGGFKVPGKVLALGAKAAKFVGEMFGAGWQSLKGFVTGITGHVGFGIFTSNRLVVTRLEQIYLLLNNRLPGEREAIPSDFGGKGLSDAGLPADKTSLKSASDSLKSARKTLSEWRKSLFSKKPELEGPPAPAIPPEEFVGPMPAKANGMFSGLRGKLKAGKDMLTSGIKEGVENAKNKHLDETMRKEGLAGWWRQAMHGAKEGDFVGPMPEVNQADFVGPMPQGKLSAAQRLSAWLKESGKEGKPEAEGEPKAGWGSKLDRWVKKKFGGEAPSAESLTEGVKEEEPLNPVKTKQSFADMVRVFTAVIGFKKATKEVRDRMTKEQLKKHDQILHDYAVTWVAKYKDSKEVPEVSSEDLDLLTTIPGEKEPTTPPPDEEPLDFDDPNFLEKFKASMAVRLEGAKGNKSLKDKLKALLQGKKKDVTDVDGDGLREGSAAEQKKDKEEEEKKSRFDRLSAMFTGLMGRMKKDKEDDKKEGKGLFGILSSLKGFSIAGLIGGLTGLFGKVMGMLGPLGKILRIGGKLLGGTGKLAWGAAKLGFKALRGVGKAGIWAFKNRALISGGLRMAGSMALRGGAMLLGGPVGWAIGAATLAYTAYKLYKHFSNSDTPLIAFRMAQYGFSIKNEDEVKKILELEETLKKFTSVSKDKKAEFIQGITPQELMAKFGVDQENQDQVQKWMMWFVYRFKPVYLSHVSVYANIMGKPDIERADTDMTSGEQLDYMKRIHFASDDKSPYGMMANPFPDSEEVDYNPKKVNELYTEINDQIKSNAGDHDKKVAEDRNKDKKTTKKIEETSWWKSTKNALSGFKDSVINAASRGIEAVANSSLYKGAVNLASKGIEYGVEGAKYAVSHSVPAMIVKAGAAIAGAIGAGWSKYKSATLEQNINAAAGKYGIDPSYLRTMAMIESGGDPNAKSSTGAAGIYQFVKSTGKAYGLFQNGVDLRFDEAANVEAGARFARDNYDYLTKKLGRPPEPWMLYLAHQQGVGGLAQIMKAAMTGTDVSPAMRKAMDLNGGKGLSPQEFLDVWKQKYAKKEAQANGTVASADVASAAKPKVTPSNDAKAAANKAVTSTPVTPATKNTPVTPVATGSPMPNAGGATPSTNGIKTQTAKAVVTPVVAAGISSSPSTPSATTGGVNDAEKQRLIAIGRKAYTVKDSTVSMRLAPEFEATIMALFGDYFERTGKKVLVTSAYRDSAQQAKMYAAYCSGKGPMAAKPGKSKHETGNAIDINSPDANYMADKGLLKKYRLHRPYLNHPKHPEPWHIESMDSGAPADCSDTQLNLQPSNAPPSDKAIKADQKLMGKTDTPSAGTGPAATAKPTIAPVTYTPPPTKVPATDAYVAASKSKDTSLQLEQQRIQTDMNGATDAAKAAMLLSQQLQVQISMDKSLTEISQTLMRIEKASGQPVPNQPKATGSLSEKPALPGQSPTMTRTPPISLTRL